MYTGTWMRTAAQAIKRSEVCGLHLGGCNILCMSYFWLLASDRAKTDFSSRVCCSVIMSVVHDFWSNYHERTMEHWTVNNAKHLSRLLHLFAGFAICNPSHLSFPRSRCNPFDPFPCHFSVSRVWFEPTKSSNLVKPNHWSLTFTFIFLFLSFPCQAAPFSNYIFPYLCVSTSVLIMSIHTFCYRKRKWYELWGNDEWKQLNFKSIHFKFIHNLAASK